MTKPWSIDAYDIDLQSYNKENIEDYLVVTKEIEDFLSWTSNKMFIVAPKGLGKSYLLRVKSYLFRQDAKGYKFIPEGPLCERFTTIKANFSKEELNRFNSIDIWKSLWELSIYTLILRTLKAEAIPDEIASIIGNEGSLSELVAMFLQNRSKIDRLHRLVGKYMKPAVRQLQKDSEANQVAIFVDGFDEIMERLETETEEAVSIRTEVWMNAQLGAYLIARDICALNNHIKIFLSVRSEAIENRLGALTAQLEAKSVFLHYSKEQIREIFEKNILYTDAKNLADPANPDIVTRLTGFTTLRHKFVINKLSGAAVEDLFDFIYRHTFARPREIIMMGAAILKLDIEDRSNYLKVSEVVNETSNRLFDTQLRGEIIPAFDNHIFSAFAKVVDCTVIEHRYKKEFEDEIFQMTGQADAFSYFYNLGLLGGTKKTLDENGIVRFRQEFLPVGHYSINQKAMPEFEYYLLHPAINRKMDEVHKTSSFYHKENVIGYGNPFVVYPTNMMPLERHIHFGLDRDSITLVLPELQASKCMCVVADAHISNAWQLKKFREVVISVNKFDHSFKTYSDDLSEVEKQTLFNEWNDGKSSIVIIAPLLKSVQEFFDRASTISFCKPWPFHELLAELIRTNNLNRKVFYWCLRDYIGEDFLRIETLLGLSEKQKFEPVIIDRFQYAEARNADTANGILTLTIHADEYRAIYCKERKASTLQPSEFVIKLDDQRVFDFYINRTNLLVEGLYQFIRLLKFSRVKSSIPELYDELLAAFIDIQIGRLVRDLDRSAFETLSAGNTKAQFKEDLHQFAQETIARINVLNGFSDLSCEENNMPETRTKGIFPGDEIFYREIKRSKQFYRNSSVFIRLMDLLGIQPLDRFYTVFISYSVRDNKIVIPIEQRLTLMGLRVRMYEKDNPSSPLIEYMTSQVTGNDRMLFIASANSLKSMGCHTELSRCRQLIYKEYDTSKLIAIRLDDYLLEVKEEQIKDPERLDNIRMLRDINAHKYALAESPALDELDNYLLKLVNASLAK